MEKVKLGSTGLEISRVVFGSIICMDENQKDADRFVSYAVDAGVNYFDAAPTYGNSEERLGPALKEYRNKVFLACKTEKRTAKDARQALENSLRLLKTDYFDVYQMHAIAEDADIEQIFADDGALSVFINAKKEGLIRNLGITAHSEELALEALSKYDFDTVMFPINWGLHMDKGFGGRLSEECDKRQIGLLGIKSLAHRKWRSKEERQNTYPKSWCKTITDEHLGLCAIKYALSLNTTALVPPGNFEQFEFMLKNINKCGQLNEEDMQYLKDNLPGENEHIFKISEDGRCVVPNEM